METTFWATNYKAVGYFSQRWHRMEGAMNKECNDLQSIYSKIDQINSTLNLRITRPGFELAGLFSCRQENPGTTILAQYEMFGIKVETDTQSPEMGSDITLSCTISRLLDTVSLHWKQKNGRDKIHLNNTVYLIVRNIRRLVFNLYTCEVQKNGTTIITENIYVNQVTAEPSDAETEEDSITLTCSVSDVTESIRLVWIDCDGKVVAEKTVTGHNEKEKSLRLIIQKADRAKGNWTCVLLHQNSPKVIIPYYLEITRNTVFFSENSNNLVLNGPEHAGNGPVTWEWKPHSGQQLTEQLGIFHSDGTRWKVQWSKEYNDTQSLYNQINQVNDTLNLRITRPGFELAGMFSCRQGQSNTTILKQYELFGIKGKKNEHYYSNN
ncbi:uncharacterized protein LOC132823088 [Hemiscyllium ocellatum]|uniref:uncharacterized protein LOC132823088 n=1 Tax=Hemiscyllium ocellatum TaxID=170820 RepID=UPI0029664EB4|nr:uncharacterized protein LOC132823088 [Hemiscyllium ocellatum]